MRAIHMVFVHYTMCGRESIDLPQAWKTRDAKQVTCKRCLAAMAKEAKEPRK